MYGYGASDRYADEERIEREQKASRRGETFFEVFDKIVESNMEDSDKIDMLIKISKLYRSGRK